MHPEIQVGSKKIEREFDYNLIKFTDYDLAEGPQNMT